MWFQQDGATCHTTRVIMDLLRSEFGAHFISRSGPLNWSRKSCDLMPLDYSLWSYVKALQTSLLQLTQRKTTLKHLLVRYRSKCWQEYAYADGPFEAQSRSTFAWNNLQTLNYMDHTIDSNKDSMHFSEFYVFLKNFTIALKKSTFGYQ